VREVGTPASLAARDGSAWRSLLAGEADGTALPEAG
jgi:hypothetical protein